MRQPSLSGREASQEPEVAQPALATLLLMLLCLLPGTGLAFEEATPRYALVIGNSDYRAAPLRNAANDARDVARELDALGYDVHLHVNVDATAMLDAAREFFSSIRERDVVTVFYYAGHAVQVDSINYLMPIGMTVSGIDDLAQQAFPLGQVLHAMKSNVSSQNVIVLDACRNNPFAAQSGSALAGLNDGLAAIDPPANTLVAYATEPGGVALDGRDRNGVYTAALLKYIREPLQAEDFFRKVRREVMSTTSRQQIPWEHSSLTREFYFGPPANQSVSDIVSF